MRRFWILLILISVLGFLLRHNHYDQIPVLGEVEDEVHYAWAGQSWIQTGIPASWSFLSSYKNFQLENIHGQEYRIVSPMIEKPPLYSMLSGGLVLLNQEKTFAQVRLATIRILPLLLSLITIISTGLFAAKIFNQKIGLISALIYAITPTIVIANRISVTENLLTPLVLISLIIICHPVRLGGSGSQKSIFPIIGFRNKFGMTTILFLLSGLAILTKQTGIVLPIALMIIAFANKNKRLIFAMLLSIGIFSLINFLIGMAYDGQLYLNLMSEQRRIGLQGGLPQLAFTILGSPNITTTKLFLDGVMLMGWILLFSAPFWIFEQLKQKSIYLLTFPICYLTYLALFFSASEKLGSGQAFWGWYVYPLYPFAIILVAWMMERLITKFSLVQSIFISIILGSSAIRFMLLSFDRSVYYRWQWLMMLLVLANIIIYLVKNKRLQKILTQLLLLFFLGVELWVSMNLGNYY